MIKKYDSVLGSTGKKSTISLIGVSAMIIIWSILSFAGIVSPLLLPSPLRVLMAVKDIGIDLLGHLVATSIRIIAGYSLGVLIGVITGVLMQYNRRVFLLVDGIVETSRPVPPVALVPFFILWFGFTEFGKILLVTSGTALIITITIVEAFERVPASLIRWGLVVGLSRRELFRLIILPAAIPEMRAGFRIALGVAITLVVVSEFMGATYGMGYLINVSKVTLSTASILLGIILIGWMSWAFDKFLRYFFSKKCAWDIRAKGAML